VQTQRLLRGEQVAWRTPTGNPVNPLSFLPQLALHAWLPPSVTLLRLTALMSGLAGLGVNYFLCRRVFDQQLAAISTVILAVLPAMVAYSRFAWDASQSVLVTLPVMYCALGAIRYPDRRRGWLTGAVAAQCLALLVHPTNVFVAPLIVTAAVWCWRRELVTVFQHVQWRRGHVVLATLIFAVVAVGLAIGLRARLAAGVERVVSPSQWASYAARIVDLLSGTTIYRYIPGVQLDGSEAATLAYRLAAWLIVLAAGYGVWRSLRTRTHTMVHLLAAGTAVSLTSYYVVAGPQAIQPHFERYGMWIIGPMSLLLAIGVRWWMRHPIINPKRARRRIVPSWAKGTVPRLRPAIALLLAWGVLAGFGWYYFRPLRLGLGQSHIAFRTGAIEPKLAALQLINSQAARPVQIVANGWWAYWPLAYFASAHPQWQVVPRDVPGEHAQPPSDAWEVAFAGLFHGPDSPATRLENSHLVRDAAGRPLLWVVPPRASAPAAPLRAD
jgi:hypothetical protein